MEEKAPRTLQQKAVMVGVRGVDAERVTFFKTRIIVMMDDG